MKKVSTLSAQEVIELQEMQKNGKTSRQRERCHLILLSHSNYTVKQLVSIFRFTEKTVSTIINKYNENKIAGLIDNPRSGRPNALTGEEKEFALKMIAIDSRDLTKILSELKNKFNKVICKQTLIRFIKKKSLFGNVFVNP